MFTKSSATDLLYSALIEPIGLHVQCNAPAKLKQKLYAVRRELDDHSLSRLQFRTIDDTTLFITKGKDSDDHEGN